MADPADLAAQRGVLVPQRNASASLPTRLRSTAAGAVIGFRAGVVGIDGSVEGASQAPRGPLPRAEKLQARPGIVSPNGTRNWEKELDAQVHPRHVLVLYTFAVT
ncbi:hypothetical protein OHB53_10315 [Streptomyces sp. NBC_00056]|uniref:hypothetical protein n=1 Tax=unclassified Streptomyces TaxID=2593676 RepID=UPI002E81B8DF|nr:hypothetical protein [Streptomyces sp. NBC_00569]WUB92618.1 hypothetical protein OHO83_10055 [Streptomyces sp. NBC_00569]